MEEALHRIGDRSGPASEAAPGRKRQAEEAGGRAEFAQGHAAYVSQRRGCPRAAADLAQGAAKAAAAQAAAQAKAAAEAAAAKKKADVAKNAEDAKRL